MHKICIKLIKPILQPPQYFFIVIALFLFLILFSPLKTQAVTVVHKTVAQSGGDFTTLNAAVTWFANNYPDFVSSDIIGEIEITGTWSNPDTTSVYQNGTITTDDAHYLYIHATGNARHTGKWTDNAYRLAVGNYNCLDLRGINHIVDGIQINPTATADNKAGIYFDSSDSSKWAQYKNIIIKGVNSGTYTQKGFKIGGGHVYIWNSLIYNISSFSNSDYTTNCIYSSATTYVYNSVCVGGHYGIYRVNGTLTVKNCYAGGSSSGDYSGTMTKVTCASSDATGSSGLQNIAVDTNTFVNVMSGSEDFHLASESSPLYHAGTDTSGDPAPMNFTTDIDGDNYYTTRSIGIDEIPPTPVVVTNAATNVTTTAATLNGVLDIDGKSSVNVFFRWRIKGTSEFVSTTPQTKTASTTFSEELTNLATGTIYEYKAVVSWDSQEKEGSLMEFSTDFIPPVPGNNGTITTSNISATGLTLNWTKATDNVTNQANLLYQVYYATSSNLDTVANIEANGTPLNTYTANLDTFNVSNLTPETTYYFNLIVKDEGNNKIAYTMKSATTLADTEPPSIPSNLSVVTTTSFSLTFSWSTSTDNVLVVGYKIFRCHTSNCTPSFQIATTTNPSYTDTDVNASSTYTYAVLAYDSSNNKSNKSTTLTINILPSNTIYANSPSYDDVSAAIALANPGDTVVIPAGSATWNSQLVITKGIILKGSGIDKTVITCNYTGDGSSFGTGGYFIVYAPSIPQDNQPFRLTGFTFNLNNKLNTGGLLLRNTTNYHQTKIRIDHTRWDNVISSKAIWWVYGYFWGVADNNYFDTPGNMRFYGLDSTTWASETFNFGSANNFYLEDNFFRLTNDDYFYIEGAGRLALRYNMIYCDVRSGGYYPVVDVHGNQASAWSAAMGFEGYSNQFYASYPIQVIKGNGGRILFHNNTITQSEGSSMIAMSEGEDDSNNPPAHAPDGQPQHISDSYIFNNYRNGAVLITDFPYISGQLYYSDEGFYVPTEDIHFWKHNSSFDGTSGVGVGLLSQRPTTCTAEKVAWWATDESRLYRWKNGKWELYYTPYTYPHPLRADKTPMIDKINVGAGARIYGNGKFSDLATTTSDINADLSILPLEGNNTIWLDVLIDAWQTNGNYYKKWSESSTNLGSIKTLHIIGDLKPSTQYMIKVDGVLASNEIVGDNCSQGVCLSDANGKITFTYTGGYSEHIFEITENQIPFEITENQTPTKANVQSRGFYSSSASSQLEISEQKPVLTIQEIKSKIIESQQKVLELLQQLVFQLLQQLVELIQKQVIELQNKLL